MQTLSISKEFSAYPGARYISDGKFSGEAFFNQKLKAAFQEALDTSEKLCINLDGTFGYASSFLSESFGLLAEHFSPAIVLNNLIIVSQEEPDWKDAILKNYIPNALNRMKGEPSA